MTNEKGYMVDFVDNLIHVSIHKDDVDREPKRVRQFIEENARVQFYPGGLKAGKPFDKVKEFKRVLKQLKQIRYKYGESESNVECIVYDQLMELMQRMMLKDLRRLNLEKLK